MNKIRLLAFAAVALLGMAGCKQGVGDRCEVLSDCEDGLDCSTGANRTCEIKGSSLAADAPTAGSDARSLLDATIATIDSPLVIPDSPPSVADAPSAADAPEADAAVSGKPR